MFGFASGEIPRLPANIVLLRNRTAVGVDWGDWSREGGVPQGNAALLADVLERIGRGVYRPRQPSTAPMVDVDRVLELLGERQAISKYVLRPWWTNMARRELFCA